jgi:hypothetical protein
MLNYNSEMSHAQTDERGLEGVIYRDGERLICSHFIYVPSSASDHPWAAAKILILPKHKVKFNSFNLSKNPQL